MNFLKRVAGSRAGQILFTIHFHYESSLLKALLILNLPSLIIAGIIGNPFARLKSLSESFWWVEWLNDAIAFICVSAQWWLIGYCVERILSMGRRG